MFFSFFRVLIIFFYSFLSFASFAPPISSLSLSSPSSPSSSSSSPPSNFVSFSEYRHYLSSGHVVDLVNDRVYLIDQGTRLLSVRFRDGLKLFEFDAPFCLNDSTLAITSITGLTNINNETLIFIALSQFSSTGSGLPSGYPIYPANCSILVFDSLLNVRNRWSCPPESPYIYIRSHPSTGRILAISSGGTIQGLAKLPILTASYDGITGAMKVMNLTKLIASIADPTNKNYPVQISAFTTNNKGQLVVQTLQYLYSMQPFQSPPIDAVEYILVIDSYTGALIRPATKLSYELWDPMNSGDMYFWLIADDRNRPDTVWIGRWNANLTNIHLNTGLAIESLRVNWTLKDHGIQQQAPMIIGSVFPLPLPLSLPLPFHGDGDEDEDEGEDEDEDEDERDSFISVSFGDSPNISLLSFKFNKTVEEMKSPLTSFYTGNPPYEQFDTIIIDPPTNDWIITDNSLGAIKRVQAKTGRLLDITVPPDCELLDSSMQVYVGVTIDWHDSGMLWAVATTESRDTELSEIVQLNSSLHCVKVFPSRVRLYNGNILIDRFNSSLIYLMTLHSQANYGYSYVSAFRRDGVFVYDLPGPDRIIDVIDFVPTAAAQNPRTGEIFVAWSIFFANNSNDRDYYNNTIIQYSRNTMAIKSIKQLEPIGEGWASDIAIGPDQLFYFNIDNSNETLVWQFESDGLIENVNLFGKMLPMTPTMLDAFFVTFTINEKTNEMIAIICQTSTAAEPVHAFAQQLSIQTWTNINNNNNYNNNYNNKTIINEKDVKPVITVSGS